MSDDVTETAPTMIEVDRMEFGRSDFGPNLLLTSVEGGPRNVIEALACVMRDLPGIGRTEHSEAGYDYRGIESITRHVQPLFAKYGIVATPHVRSRTVKEFTINSRPWTEDVLEVTYTVYGPGGVDDHITVGPLIGLGRDNSDKGANKSETQAFKYFLIQTLCIGDAKDDPDREAAHEADPAVETIPPETMARRTFKYRVEQGSPEMRQAVRGWCDEHDYGRIVADWDDATLEAATEFLDRWEIDRDATATQAPESPPESPESVSEGSAAIETAGNEGEPSSVPSDSGNPAFDRIVDDVAAMSAATVKAAVLERYATTGIRGSVPKDNDKARALLATMIAEEQGVVIP